MENKNKDFIPKAQVEIMLEGIRGDFKVFGDGLKDVQREQKNLSERFNKFDVRLSGVEDKVSMDTTKLLVIDGNLREMKRDNKDNYKTIIEYLSRIEDEIQSMKTDIKYLKENLKEKADLDRLRKVEKSLAKLEKLILATE